MNVSRSVRGTFPPFVFPTHGGRPRSRGGLPVAPGILKGRPRRACKCAIISGEIYVKSTRRSLHKSGTIDFGAFFFRGVGDVLRSEIRPGVDE